jgi:coenzyme F420-reducing hydrogenase beta subunit
LRCYRGFSLVKELYERASTGGIATSLALVSLKHGYADGMFVLNRNVYPPVWIIAKNKKDLLNACGSTYEDKTFQIGELPQNLSTHLGQVGKPCDIIQPFSPKISLFCSHTYRPKRKPVTKDYARLPKHKIRTFFENPVKCFLCKDHLGLTADVNVGDSQEDSKVNVLIARSKLGVELVEHAIEKEFLQLEEISYLVIKNKQPYLWR